MGRKKRQEESRKELYDLLWSDAHWLFATEEVEARERLQRLADTPEVRQWGGQLQASLCMNLAPDIPRLWVGGIPKVLLPPQVMARLLDRVGIAYTSRWLHGLAPLLFLCREVPRGQALMAALAAVVGGIRFEFTGNIAVAERDE